MEENTNQTKPQYGKIEEGYFLCVHVGDGTASDGTQFEVVTTMNGAPMVRLGKRAFILSWQEICQMAEDAGLFNKGAGDVAGKK